MSELREAEDRGKQFLVMVVYVYGGIGIIFGVLGFVSAGYYYGLGPGAFWNIGFAASTKGLAIAFFQATLRVVLWPVGVYQVIAGEVGFFEWLLYLWYSG